MRTAQQCCQGIADGTDELTHQEWEYLLANKYISFDWRGTKLAEAGRYLISKYPAPIHPLHTESIIRGIIETKDTMVRRTGRSTVQALRLLANAIANPGVKYYAADHYGTPAANLCLLKTTDRIVTACGLQHMHFNGNECSVVFENRERAK